MTPTASTLRLPNLLLAIRRLLPWLNLPAGADVGLPRGCALEVRQGRARRTSQPGPASAGGGGE
ncbi:MAG: hypothetical protein ACKOTF_06800, partial [Opitutaceae bacterium]